MLYETMLQRDTRRHIVAYYSTGTQKIQSFSDNHSILLKLGHVTVSIRALLVVYLKEKVLVTVREREKVNERSSVIKERSKDQ